MINKSKQQNFRLFFFHPHASQIPQPVSLAKICLFWKKSCILGLRRKNKKSKLKKHQTNPKKTKKECLIQKEKYIEFSENYKKERKRKNRKEVSDAGRMCQLQAVYRV